MSSTYNIINIPFIQRQNIAKQIKAQKQPRKHLSSPERRLPSYRKEELYYHNQPGTTKKCRKGININKIKKFLLGSRDYGRRRSTNETKSCHMFLYICYLQHKHHSISFSNIHNIKHIGKGSPEITYCSRYKNMDHMGSNFIKSY